jgi:hypothetical protein
VRNDRAGPFRLWCAAGGYISRGPAVTKKARMMRAPCGIESLSTRASKADPAVVSRTSPGAVPPSPVDCPQTIRIEPHPTQMIHLTTPVP